MHKHILQGAAIMTPLFSEPINLVTRGLHERPKLRLFVLLVSLFTMVLCLGLFVFRYRFVPEVGQAIAEVFPGIIAITGVALFLSFMSFGNIDTSSSIVDGELEMLREERKNIQKRLADSKSGGGTEKENVFDIVQLNLNQISEYYTINKSQARNSFALSVSAIVLGLAILLVGILIFYRGEKPNIGLTAISGIAGVLIEFIGGAYFYLYNKSLKQLNFFYGTLVKMQDTMLAIKLSESLNKTQEAATKEKIIAILMNRSSGSDLQPAQKEEATDT
jgi:hypothetical protein